MKAKSGDSQEPFVVWTLGCSGIGSEMRRRGLETRSWRSVDALLKPGSDLTGLRAILLRDEALGKRPLETTFRAIRSRYPLVDVLLWAPGARGSRVREALHAGAHDVILSPSPSVLTSNVAEAIEQQRYLPRMQRTRFDGTKTRFEGMLSRNRAMWDVFDGCERVARTDATVLVLGETGTGKELVARAIHRRSHRSGRFVAVNCGAIARDLIDSEFFGHVKGAFTGATGEKRGLFRHAEAGTLFLDEIASIPMSAQASLLRVLQEGEIRPVGGHDEVPVDVRVVAATSEPLEDHVRANRFREDLFYRLDVIRFELPALRERPEDIFFLFAQFAARAAKQYKVDRPDVSDAFLDELTSYRWPGNVRELENFAERLVLSMSSAGPLGRRHFRRLVRQPAGEERESREPRGSQGPSGRSAARPGPLDFSATLEEAVRPWTETAEREYLVACLKQNRGMISETAEHAGISRRTLLRKMNQYGLEKADFKTNGRGSRPAAD